MMLHVLLNRITSAHVLQTENLSIYDTIKLLHSKTLKCQISNLQTLFCVFGIFAFLGMLLGPTVLWGNGVAVPLVSLSYGRNPLEDE